MIRSLELLAFGISLGVPCNLVPVHTGQRLARCSPKPEEAVELQIFGDDDPDDAAAGLFTQAKAHFDVRRLAADSSGFELDVPHDFGATNDKVKPAGVEFGTKHLNIDNPCAPKAAKKVSGEYVLDDPLTKDRVKEVRVRTLVNIF